MVFEEELLSFSKRMSDCVPGPTDITDIEIFGRWVTLVPFQVLKMLKTVDRIERTHYTKHANKPNKRIYISNEKGQNTHPNGDITIQKLAIRILIE